MIATFQLPKNNHIFETYLSAKEINSLRKLGWKLINLKIRLCIPIKCVLCDEIVATQNKSHGYSVEIKESVCVNGKSICVDCCDKINSVLDDNPYDR